MLKNIPWVQNTQGISFNIEDRPLINPQRQEGLQLNPTHSKKKHARPYILSKDIALRSWSRVPYAYYHRQQTYASGLTREEFATLLQCDGQHELIETPILKRLISQDLCHPATPKEELSAWQKPRYARNRHFPKIFWSITERCPYHCRHCYNWTETDSLPEFSWQECLDLIEAADACGIQRFKLTGGEPLMHPHFLDIVREIHSRGMEVEKIYTSGACLTPEILTSLHQIGCQAVFKIAFDGIGQHDWLHQQAGAEETSRKAMQLCLKNGFTVHAIINVHRQNIDTLLPTAVMLDHLGVQAMQILRTTESPAFRKYAPDASLPAKEYLDGLVHFIPAYLASGAAIPIEIWSLIRLHPQQIRKNKTQFLKDFAAFSTDETCRLSRPVCRSNRALVGVAADGELYPCLTMTGLLREKGISFGNVKQHNLMELLTQGDYIQAIGTTLQDLKNQNSDCAGCPYFPRCWGGCRAYALALTGDYMGTDSFSCTYQKEGYWKKIYDAIQASAAGT